MHSATKFLGGHADAMGGVAVSRDQADSMALIGVMKLVGGVLSPWEAHEILRGLKTLAVRMDRHCENAAALAEHLRNHPRIGRVYFPGFAAAEQRDVVQRILRDKHMGAMVSIELKDNSREAAFRFMDALKALRAVNQSRRCFHQRAASGDGFASRPVAGAAATTRHHRWIGSDFSRH